jgi:hypothetical protein
VIAASDDDTRGLTNYRTSVMWVPASVTGLGGGFWSIRHYCLTCRALFDSTPRTGGTTTIADLVAHAENHGLRLAAVEMSPPTEMGGSR